MRQIRIITRGSQMAMADVLHLRKLIAERMQNEAPGLPYNVETRDSIDLVMIEATTAQPAGELVINNAGDIAYWDDEEEPSTASSICICGHAEEDHGPSGACESAGCLCACYETYEE